MLRLGLVLLLIVINFHGSVAQSFGINPLINDSWQNAGNWFKGSYEQNDAVYWTLGGFGVLAVMANDQRWQATLQLENPTLRTNINGFSEAFGDPYVMGALGLGTYLGASLSDNKDLQGLSSTALQSMLTAGVAVLALKLVFHRVRPEEQITLDPYDFRGPSFASDNLSFPSGHTTIAFALASCISAYYDDPYYLAIPLYTLASLTAWQRVYDQKHWPSDVLMGALLGTYVGRKMAKWQKGRSAQVSLAPNPWGMGLGFRMQLDPNRGK